MMQWSRIGDWRGCGIFGFVISCLICGQPGVITVSWTLYIIILLLHGWSHTLCISRSEESMRLKQPQSVLQLSNEWRKRLFENKHRYNWRHNAEIYYNNCKITNQMYQNKPAQFWHNVIPMFTAAHSGPIANNIQNKRKHLIYQIIHNELRN